MVEQEKLFLNMSYISPYKEPYMYVTVLLFMKYRELELLITSHSELNEQTS